MIIQELVSLKITMLLEHVRLDKFLSMILSIFFLSEHNANLYGIAYNFNKFFAFSHD